MKTDKYILTTLLEITVENYSEPPKVDILLIEGFFLLHTNMQTTKIFGQISVLKAKLVSLFPDYLKVYLVFDIGWMHQSQTT